MAAIKPNTEFAGRQLDNVDQETKDADETSSSGTSSSGESDDSSSGEDNATSSTKIRTTKPRVNNNLKSRLSAFLPEIEKANKDLEDGGDALAKRVDDVGDDEQHYVEMNLGLGVLEEKNSASGIQVADGDSSEEESSGDTSLLGNSGMSNEQLRKGKIEEI